MRRVVRVRGNAVERESDPDQRRGWLTFAIVGPGPTGVELAGTLAEIARRTLRQEFRRFDMRSVLPSGLSLFHCG